MSESLNLNFNRPLGGIDIVGGEETAQKIDAIEVHLQNQATITSQIQQRYEQLDSTANALASALSEFASFESQIINAHRNLIIRLSTEIARKLVPIRYEDNEHDIESMLQESLNTASDAQEITLKLNPDDIATCRELVKENPDHPLARINMVTEPRLSRGEHILESDKGTIEYKYSQLLERIEQELLRDAGCE